MGNSRGIGSNVRCGQRRGRMHLVSHVAGASKWSIDSADVHFGDDLIPHEFVMVIDSSFTQLFGHIFVVVLT